MQLREIARIVAGKLYGKPSLDPRNLLPPEQARKFDLTILHDPGTRTKARVVITPALIRGKTCIVVKDTRYAMYRLLKKLSQADHPPSISPRAIIGPQVKLSRNCTVEPNAFIKDRARIGDFCFIGANCVIEEDVRIGKYCQIHAGVILYRNTVVGDHAIFHAHTVIGKPGFGYVKRRRYHRLAHIGRVVIGDHVEIGSNVTVDRGTIGDTRIGDGTKIDNLVHIGHNVTIGKNCLIMGQCGIAGSSMIGDNVILCGQTGVSDHVRIGNNAIIHAKSAVFKSLPGDKRYSGIPAREHNTVLQALARLYNKK